MSYAVGSHFEGFIKKQVQVGRYNNASEVVREGLRLVEEREMKLKVLRSHVENAISKGGENTEDEVLLFIESELDNLNDKQ
jgi:antitoxin ParD1/3/4